MIRSFLKHKIRSFSLQGIHSPFVFELETKVLGSENAYYAYGEIENLRQKMSCDLRIITVKDYGTGSSGNRMIAEIAGKAVKPKKFGQLLFRLVEYYKPQIILELGTSLGISTAYLAKPLPDSRVFSFEGCPEIARIARENFESLNLKNIELTIGNFDETLEEKLNSLPQLDLVFFDGNHRLEPTLRYFEWCKRKSHNGSLFIFDDINWSPEMQEAWTRIKADPDVTITIDLFHIGLVFFRKEQAKQDFYLKF